MLNPNSDNQIGETKSNREENAEQERLKQEQLPKLKAPQENAQEAHLHKTISSIFGGQAVPKNNPYSAKETSNAGQQKMTAATFKFGLIFKVLLILSVALILFFYGNGQKEASRRIEMEGKLTQTTAEARALEASLESIQEKVKATDQLKAELNQARNSSLEIEKNLQSFTQEKSKLETALQEKDKQIEELSNQLKALEKSGSLVGKRMYSSSTTSDIPEKTPQMLTENIGKILVVKPASSIAVINLGSRNGIKVGSTFDIFTSDDSYLCALVIDEVEDTVSIGKISPIEFASKVRENYIVKLR